MPIPRDTAKERIVDALRISRDIRNIETDNELVSDLFLSHAAFSISVGATVFSIPREVLGDVNILHVIQEYHFIVNRLSSAFDLNPTLAGSYVEFFENGVVIPQYQRITSNGQRQGCFLAHHIKWIRSDSAGLATFGGSFPVNFNYRESSEVRVRIHISGTPGLDTVNYGQTLRGIQFFRIH